MRPPQPPPQRASSPLPPPRRRSTSDPLAAVLRPPDDETPAERELRLADERRARDVSDAIDEQLRRDRVELRRTRPDVKVLLLGQSESGKSTTLKQFQLTHTPKAFSAERMAWRSVIYLNLVRSVRRILEAISPDPDEPLVVPATALYTSTSFAPQAGPSSAPLPSSSSPSFALPLQSSSSAPAPAHAFASTSVFPSSSSTAGQPQSPRTDARTAADKYASYAARLAPLVELEDRLIRMLSDDTDDGEATRLADGSAPGWATASSRSGAGGVNSGVGVSAGGPLSSASSVPGAGVGRPAIQLETHSLPASPAARSPVTRPGQSGSSASSSSTTPEVAVRTPKWKLALSLARRPLPLRSAGTDSSEVVGWWEDPADPVHALYACGRDMRALWADEWVRRRLSERRIRLEESSGFYLDEIDRITAKKYIPTDDDILKARLKTVGVQEHSFTLTGTPHGGAASKPMVWKIYDVGGARNQRQAWAPYFTDVNAIIFLAPISAFDQVLAEDPRVNRLEDSLLLWRSVVSNKLLQHVNLIIFLNKCDLLKAKLEKGVRLNQFLISYNDRPNDYDSVSKYLRNKFGWLHQQHTPNPNRELFIHFTAVTDTRRTSTIIANVRDIIVRRNLKDSKLLV